MKSQKNTIRKAVALAVAALGFGLAQQAVAGDVAFYGDSPFGANRAGLVDLYATTPGSTGANIAGLSGSTLSGIELLWLFQPSNAYSSDDLSVLGSYLQTGGRIAFLGEHGALAPTQNNNITAAISALGGHIAINNLVLDSNYRVANSTGSGSGGTILNHALTNGVSQYQYAAFAPLLVGGPAQTLMLGDDGTSVMMAYENIGAGSIFLITDQNVFDTGVISSYDNTRMFRNLVSAVTGAVAPQAVPEPGSLALFGLAFAGMMVSRRRKTAA